MVCMHSFIVNEKFAERRWIVCESTPLPPVPVCHTLVSARLRRKGCVLAPRVIMRAASRQGTTEICTSPGCGPRPELGEHPAAPRSLQHCHPAGPAPPGGCRGPGARLSPAFLLLLRSGVLTRSRFPENNLGE